MSKIRTLNGTLSLGQGRHDRHQENDYRLSKEQRNTVTEYAASLSEEDLKLLSVRMNERMCGDLAEALDSMSKDRTIDDMLSLAAGPTELYDMCDQIREVLVKECRRRGVPLKSSSIFV